MALQIRNLPVTLQNLITGLREDNVMCAIIDGLITESQEVVASYVSAMETEGGNILSEKSNLIRIRHPSAVDVNRLQCALNEFKIAVSGALKQMKVLEHKVHAGIGKCQQKQRDNERDISAKEIKIEELNTEITNLKQKIKDCERQATNNENEARELSNKASKMEKEKEDAEVASTIGGSVGVTASILLAPFSGGASLLMAGAAASWVGGTLLIADEYRSKARTLERCASDERSNARKARQRKDKLVNEKSSIRDQISDLRKKKRKLENTCRILEQVNECLLTYIELMNSVETHVQDLDASVHGATVHGETFDIIKNALNECPDCLEEEAMTCMMELREKWQIVENEILKTFRRV
ncbi:uncharacterized protein LOC123546433 [Mercenaria mercenaria]|uniref:uncharacterized protein LOC123546433 n=1 Tax=Mercenaria mercenaria TaxID=6596 RepID=UPI00234E8B2C|nr:uncharacterized protein LOC123546433 [Mercenaria mercenaria]XP_045188622.2 uncharacterized protein LOC123546433 [Mercenaria mercenaria]XP_045188623.2 uncharacterized protein LOC123546433 [Mercenaria mercenaria]